MVPLDNSLKLARGRSRADAGLHIRRNPRRKLWLCKENLHTNVNCNVYSRLSVRADSLENSKKRREIGERDLGLAAANEGRVLVV